MGDALQQCIKQSDTAFALCAGTLKQGSLQQSCYVPFETINGLYYISTRNDTGPDPPHTRANDVIIFLAIIFRVML